MEQRQLETVELEGNVQLSRAPFKDEPDLFFTTEYIKGYLDTYRFETDRKVYMRRGIDTTEASNGMKYDNILHTVELDAASSRSSIPTRSPLTHPPTQPKNEEVNRFQHPRRHRSADLGPEHRQEPAH